MTSLVEVSTAGKKVSRYVSGVNESVFLAAQWNPFAKFNAAGDPVTAATIQQLVTGLQFAVNGAAEVTIGTYTGATGTADQILYADANANTVKKVIDIINGVGAGHPAPGSADYFTRWRALLADVRPGFALSATSGQAVAATPVLFGRNQIGLRIRPTSSGLPTANIIAAALGTGFAKEGGAQRFPDHFESEYVTDTTGNRFPVRSPLRRQEEQPGHARYTVHLTDIVAQMAFATTKEARVYDIDDNLLAVYPMGTATTVPEVSELTPLVGPPGSPLFVEIVGTGALTNGPLSITGEIRIA